MRRLWSVVTGFMLLCSVPLIASADGPAAAPAVSGGAAPAGSLSAPSAFGALGGPAAAAGFGGTGPAAGGSFGSYGAPTAPAAGALGNGGPLGGGAGGAGTYGGVASPTGAFGASGLQGTGMPGIPGTSGLSGMSSAPAPIGAPVGLTPQGVNTVTTPLNFQSPSQPVQLLGVQAAGMPAAGPEAPPQGQGVGGTFDLSGRDSGELARRLAPVARPELSDAEKLMSTEDDAMMKPQPFKVGSITQFGYTFFRQPGSFAPVIDVPVGPDYVVGPGDVLIVSTWGSVDAVLPLEVNRSGEITLPRVGSLRVWGTPFGKLPELVKGALGKAFKDVHVNVTMGKLKLMKVYLVGEVAAPGDYDISSLSTVINALAAAGGPTKQGTLRAIQVVRGGRVVETVDLYDFFLKGDKSRDIRLQPGDTINVPIHGSLVGAAGNVRKPAIYEFRKEFTLKDLLEVSGGIAPSSYLQRVQISRIVANEKKIVADFSFDPKLPGKSLEERAAGIRLQDLDVVKVFPIDFTVRDHVQLEGYVLRPGGYALKPEMRVRDLILPDNILPEYYPETLEITRLVPPDYHPERIYLNLEGVLKGSDKDNILLKEFDVVRVFSRWEMEDLPRVRVYGEIRKPGDYRILDRMTLRDLVLSAGNLKKTAYLKSAEITRSQISKEGVKTRVINVDLDEALKGNPKDNILLENFDEVMIRRLPEWKEETDRYFTLTGEVRFPGVYPIQKGETLSSVIERAGGFTERAYFRAAKFTRKLTQEIQQKRMEEVILRTEAEIARKQQELTSVAASKEELEATKSTLEGMKGSLDKLKLAKAEGRISIVLEPLDKLKKSPYDLELQGGDALNVPQSSKSVMAFGEVYNPTTVIEVPGGTVDFYLKKAGGPTTNADRDEMYVVRADGTVVSKREKKGFFSDPFMTMPLEAGDAIVVPQQIEKVAWMRDLKDIATIIGQTALAAGVLIAAGL